MCCCELFFFMFLNFRWSWKRCVVVSRKWRVYTKKESDCRKESTILWSSNRNSNSSKKNGRKRSLKSVCNPRKLKRMDWDIHTYSSDVLFSHFFRSPSRPAQSLTAGRAPKVVRRHDVITSNVVGTSARDAPESESSSQERRKIKGNAGHFQGNKYTIFSARILFFSEDRLII